MGARIPPVPVEVMFGQRRLGAGQFEQDRTRVERQFRRRDPRLGGRD